MISAIISRLVILIFGTLYPAYASYKAVRAKNLKEYVKWMMYWIVFALFTCAETFTDVFLSWFPFYYEVKIVLVMWLLSPATGGSSILYRKFVHPALCRREQEIDEYISKAKEQGYHTVLNLGTKGVNYATTVIMQTAIKNLNLANLNEHQERVGRAMLRERSETDSPNSSYYGDTDFDIPSPQRVEREHTPKIVEIESNTDMEYEENHVEKETASTSSARSRGYVKKRDVIKKPRSKSGGRKTRSKTARESNNAEIVVNDVLHVY